MLSVIQLPDILTQVGPPNAGVTLHVHVVSQGQNYLLDLNCQLPGGGQAQHLGLPHGGVNALQDADREGGGLTSS